MITTITRTYRLNARTVDALDATVARLGIPQSALVDALLDFSLTAEAAGKLVIARRPVKWELERVYTEK